jgi:uncharacterized membrane protein
MQKEQSEFKSVLPQLKSSSAIDGATQGRSPVDIALLFLFVVAALAVIGTIVYIAVLPQRGETFTEFYILGSQNKAIDYPTELVLGETGEVTLVIINREQKTLDYTIEVMINGMPEISIGPVTLEDGQKWESPVSFSPTTSGDNQRVAFALNKSDGSPAPGPLELWVNVR